MIAKWQILFSIFIVWCSYGSFNPAGAAVPLTDFFPFGSVNGDSSVPSGDDTFEPVSLRYPFQFFNQSYPQLFVNINGAISFQAGISAFTPVCGSTTVPMITPFWADVLTSGGQGIVSYRESTDRKLLQKANNEILQPFPDFHDLSLGWLFISTWSEVGFYGASSKCSGLGLRNTFQLVLTTDGTHSFVIIYYNKVSWTTGTASGGSCTGQDGNPAKAGFDVGDGKTFHQLPGSCSSSMMNIGEQSNVGQNGKWVFRVDNAYKAAPGCSAEKSKLKIKPAFVSMLGNVPITIRGPCLDDAKSVVCTFEDSREAGVPGTVSEDKQSVSCVVPFLYSVGRLRVDLIVTSRTKTVTHSGFIYTTDAEEDLENLKIVRDSNGDAILSFTWNPSFFNDSKEESSNGRRSKRAVHSIDSAPTLDVRVLRFAGQKWVTAGTIQTNITNSGNFSRRVSFGTIDSVAKPSVSAITLDSAGFRPKRTAHLICPQVLQSAQANVEECQAWFEKERGPPTDFLPCPPTERQAQEDSRFQQDTSSKQNMELFHPGADSVFKQRVPGPTGAGSQCVYKNGRILVGPPSGGSVFLTSPGSLTMSPSHFLSDVSPRCACCVYSNDPASCRKYFEKRPSDPGTAYAPSRPSRAVGDPHITTFDHFAYTFNGVGEYWMIRSEQFSLQARMEQYGTTRASVFTAFVAEQRSIITSETVKAQIFVREAGQIGLFIDDELIELEASVEFSVKSLALSYEHPGKIVLDFSSGFSLEFSTGGLSFLNIISSANGEQMGKLAGLLGNYDGNEENDLTAPDGTIINSRTSTLEDIHTKFGLKWIITAPEESLFRYSSGKSFSTYQNLNFVPNFNIPALSSIPDHIKAVCNSSRECMFDYATTGSLAVATITRDEVIAFEEKVETVELKIETCEPMVAPINGYLNATNFFLGTTLRFGCEAGFELTGNERLVCIVSDGGNQWNGSPPTCVPKGSGADYPPIIVDGMLYCLCGDDAEHGDNELGESTVNIEGTLYCPCDNE